MKNVISFLLAGLLALSLTACGSKPKEPAPFATDDAQTLLDSGAFSEVLTAIDVDIACARYGVDGKTVTGGAVYGSTGATAEELAVLTFDSADHAADAAKAMGYWLADRIDSLSSYLPHEVPKLEKAVLEQRQNTLLLAVAGDYGPVEQFLAK